MDKNLQHYVKIYNNWFSDDLCSRTVDKLSSVEWHQHKFYQPTTGEIVPQSGEQELDVSWTEIDTRHEIMQRNWDGYSRYLQELNFSWFISWHGFSMVRFNRYSESRKMDEHCDHIHTIFDGTRRGIPTLTALGVLNDDYTGGEFVMWQDTILPLKKGDLVIFPSCFLYPHRVDPVTSGTRYSCVSWAW